MGNSMSLPSVKVSLTQRSPIKLFVALSPPPVYLHRKEGVGKATQTPTHPPTEAGNGEYAWH